jgi:6-phosphogluconolactonase
MTRHWFACLIACLLCGSLPKPASAQKELGVESLIYVGTHAGTKRQAKGVYLFRMRTSDDPNIPEFVKVTPLGVVAETVNPSYLEIDGKRRLLFCVNEVENFDGGKTGAVSAFSIDPDSGTLSLLNQRYSAGAGPCHLALDHSGKHLLVANAVGGSVAVLPVGADGKLGEATHVEQHAGKSVHPEHQNAPRPRGVTLSPDNRFAFVCDVGLDKVMIYAFDSKAGKLTPHEPPFAPLKPGAGPRRMLFHPKGRFAYVVNELDSTVTTFAYDAEAGALKELQSISTLPPYFDGPNTAAEIGIHPSGKVLLASNCGHHSVVLFTIDPGNGTLTYVEDQSTYGTSPRHFSLDTAGKHVVVANQDSGSILILRAPENARVKPGGNVVETPSPTCAKFLPR